ncbi:hypothetical protein TL16_g03019 [Triparma laevis f. inornata]|uniref:Uncharacterized protein n=2 Tax=Triparma laevis TaxID=1534972 RepID=A0A9W7FRC7_9STRA|nr:hypothetical protein TL16_g03019 [Triparma laevis f. inornata]GMI17587.1 hypothetical protein TrLO_g3929 [Triparma laevis f. longispina]
MNPNPTYTPVPASDDSDDIEMQGLLAPSNNHNPNSNVKHLTIPNNQPTLLQRLDDHVNVKVLNRIWGPYLEFIVRLMLVSTFLDDSLRTISTFSEHTAEVGELGLKWLSSPGLINVMATATLLIGLLAQTVGSLCLLKLFYTDGATKALVLWMIAQPMLYRQLSNFEFVAESLSLVGGLLMLRAHVINTVGARTKLFGRLLLPAMYVYYAGNFLYSALVEEETSSLANYVASLSIFLVNTLVFIGLLIGSALVATGLRSRMVALLLALVNLVFVFYQHPFFLFISFKDGTWVYDEDMPLPNVALPEDISVGDFELSQIYQLHRYYYFLGLSNSGALLLLAQFGPGEIAVQKDEVILPTRAQD